MACKVHEGRYISLHGQFKYTSTAWCCTKQGSTTNPRAFSAIKNNPNGRLAFALCNMYFCSFEWKQKEKQSPHRAGGGGWGGVKEELMWYKWQKRFSMEETGSQAESVKKRKKKKKKDLKSTMQSKEKKQTSITYLHRKEPPNR